jgi:predicted HTH transcriptional regulator|tara:strand:+ start:672 stop:1187 length:516 start_codon:yes stop_codon:yes gene_type:complete
MVIKTVLRKVFRKKTKKKSKKESKDHKVLSSWEDMYEELQEHPLTQAKIINETLFQNTNNAIEKINTRLDSMDERLIKLEKRKTRSTKEETIIVSENSDNLIKPILDKGRLSNQEELILEMIKEQGEVDAKSVSNKFDISRGNASLKLNKLHDFGLLEKRMDDKTVFYLLK